MAIQVAKLHGCRVLTTASRWSRWRCAEQLARTSVITIAKPIFVERVSRKLAGTRLPVCSTTVGGERLIARSIALRGGRLITCVARRRKRFHKSFPAERDLDLEFMGGRALWACARKPREIPARCAALVDEGKLKPHVSRVLASQSPKAIACSKPAM